MKTMQWYLILFHGCMVYSEGLQAIFSPLPPGEANRRECCFQWATHQVSLALPKPKWWKVKNDLSKTGAELLPRAGDALGAVAAAGTAQPQ